MATKPASKPTNSKPPAKAKAKVPAETPPAAGELSFDTDTTAARKNPPVASETSSSLQDEIHAQHCVVNSQCSLTPECRGRLKATNAISGKVQIYCGKCGKFAAGTRPVNGLVSGSGGKLFDRTGGK